MEPGQLINVYGDPQNKSNYEGVAILLKPIAKITGVEYWEVRFVNKSEKCNRIVVQEDLLDVV